jgi:D-threo-aldose 1-dehydrogenase
MQLTQRKLKRRELALSNLGFGGTALGNMYTAMSEASAAETLHAAYAQGLRYFDTAPLYGHGLSELRTGGALRAFADADVIVSSKVGWRLKPAHGQPTDAGLFRNITAFTRFNDYSFDGAMRSFEDSLHRLGIERIDILLIHDVDRRNQGERQPEVFRTAMSGAYKALLSLREQGLVKAIGCGLNEWEACQQFAEAGDFDCFLLAGRYTLLEQDSLATFLPLCERRGIGIILGGPYNSGILASGAVPDAWFNYAPRAGGRPAQGGRHRGGVRALFSASQSGGLAVSAVPSLRCQRHSGHAQCRRTARESAHAAHRDPRRAVV